MPFSYTIKNLTTNLINPKIKPREKIEVMVKDINNLIHSNLVLADVIER